MDNAKARSTRRYSKEYKMEALKLARQIGGKKAAAELGIPSGTMSGWQHEARMGRIDTGLGTQTPQSGMTQASEIERLKSENKALAKDNAS